MFAILGVATFLKLALYFFCVRLAARSDSMAALAEDHLNDVFSNAGAIVTAAVASVWEKGWWVDPVGAIIISLYIVYRWIDLCKGQVRSQLEILNLYPSDNVAISAGRKGECLCTSRSICTAVPVDETCLLARPLQGAISASSAVFPQSLRVQTSICLVQEESVHRMLG